MQDLFMKSVNYLYNLYSISAASLPFINTSVIHQKILQNFYRLSSCTFASSKVSNELPFLQVVTSKKHLERQQSFKFVECCNISMSTSAMFSTKCVQQPITVCVEGNIGSGKTTLLNHLSAKEGVEVFQEPVAKWRNVRGKNLLDLMYKDPVRWSHLFQSYVQLTMMQIHMQPSKAKVKVMERSIHSARHCFVENLHQTGKMSDAEYNVYCEWYNMITSNLNVPVDLIVYLSTVPSVVQQRIKARGHEEEASIPLSYLEQLHALHQSWLESGERELPAPLLVLPSEMTLQEMSDTIEKHLAVIQSKRRPPLSPNTGGVPMSPPRRLLLTPSPSKRKETAAATN